MKHSISKAVAWRFIPCLCLAWTTAAAAKPEPGECVELGALAYDNWTATDAGGSGLPAGEPEKDYIRCKSCHGWDRRGLNGGYVRRTRTAERPNAGLGDTDRSSRDIAPGMGDFYHVRAEGILHAGNGRSYADGSGSWVPLSADSTPAEKAAHAAGYTLGNQHPDFSATGANAGDIVPTQEQIDCLALFINFGDSDPAFYFIYIDTEANPAVYHIHTGASAQAGEAFYDENCSGCHGDPATDHQGMNGGHPEGGMLAYLAQDGKYSEFVHKARWGIPDTSMTRAALNEPDSQDMIDVMLYLQQLESTAFTVTSGISGTWFDTARDGEGYMIDVAAEGVVAVSFYTYDGLGNPYYLIGSGTVDGDTFVIDFHATHGAVYGADFDPLDVQREPWGTGTFTFSGCHAGTAYIEPNDAFAVDFEPLSVQISRLTPPVGCSGG
jgi:cytochrome c2